MNRSASARYSALALTLTPIAAAMLLAWQAWVKAPTSDETGHLIAGVAMVRTGDPGFYRVNPPLHKLVSGAAVEWTQDVELPGLYPASFMGSGMRNEFTFAETVIANSPDQYRTWFRVGRLIRIPIILLGGWWLLRGVPKSMKIAGMVAAILWWTSPMVLGHGWTVMPDTLSGVAMVALLITTIQWLQNRDTNASFVVGIAWGFALGTKFTFGPLFVLWPFGLLLFQFASGQWMRSDLWRLPASHLVHGVIALFFVVALYGGSEVGVTLGDHRFQSDRFARFVEHEWVAAIRSPLPKQYLVGVDEQQLDLEAGYATYVCGTWYLNGVWWYYLIGLLIKEQIVFVVGLPLILLGAFRWRRSGQTSELAGPWALCLFVACSVLLLLSWHSKMALNVRYAFPVLPALYLLIGIGVQTIVQRVGEPNWIGGRRLVHAAMVAVIGIELAINAPHFFAYANPFFGGSHRVPTALHDSNFDGAQDLWILETWLAENPVLAETDRYVCIHGDVPSVALPFSPAPPDEAALNSLKSKADRSIEIIVMRGLAAPAPWVRVMGRSNAAADRALLELLQTTPDEFLTPTIGIYRSKHTPST